MCLTAVRLTTADDARRVLADKPFRTADGPFPYYYYDYHWHALDLVISVRQVAPSFAWARFIGLLQSAGGRNNLSQQWASCCVVN
jgi:hypothetical protein